MGMKFVYLIFLLNLHNLHILPIYCAKKYTLKYCTRAAIILTINISSVNFQGTTCKLNLKEDSFQYQYYLIIKLKNGQRIRSTMDNTPPPFLYFHFTHISRLIHFTHHDNNDYKRIHLTFT